MSVANEAKAVYEVDLREKLERQYFGQFVAISQSPAIRLLQ